MGTEDESQSWYWADSDGVQSIVDEFELIASLSTGTLPAYTLVWRVGWKAWIPASQVAELANVLPKESVEPAVTPEIDAAMREPPAPPVDKYQAYRAREAAKLLGRAARQTLPTPVPPPARAVVTAAIAPPQAPPRPPQPTLLDGTHVSSTATIRPPGAVPPPPRALPQAAPPVALGLPVAPTTPTIQVADAAPLSTDQPTSPRASPEPLTAPDRLPSWSDDVDADLAVAPAPMPAPAGYVPAAAPPPRRSPVVLILAGILFLAGIVVIAAVVIVVVQMKRETPVTTSASSVASSVAPQAPLEPCRLTRPAARLAPGASIGVTPVFRALPDGKLAVGFAASQKQAEGITVDPGTLAVDRPFKQATDEAISAVVPMTSGGSRTFQVDLEGGALRSPRSLDVRPMVTLGWTDAGFARSEDGHDPTTLWPGASEKVSDTRVVPMGSDGFAVTVRRGGKTSGTILVGRLDARGASTGDPAEIDTGTQVGTPSIAANDQGLLVAFASRPTSNAYWTLRLASSSGSALPSRAVSFSTPPGGLGADAISPAVEGLTRGRWLLQWTEGAAGRRQVRAQTLGPDLVPIGDPMNLSPEGANAGQGVVMVRNEKGLGLFLVSKGRSHELWGASLSCP